MKSMTGYGAAEGKVQSGEIFVEVKSVNHRYCDISLKIPPKMSVLEPRLRKIIQSRIARGKVEVFLKERLSLHTAGEIEINIELAKKYERAIRRLRQALGLKTAEINFFDVVDLKDLISIHEMDVPYDALWVHIEPIVRTAISNLDRMRSIEGLHVMHEQSRKVGELTRVVRRIAVRSKRALDDYIRRTRGRLKNNLGGGNLEEAKLQTEVAFLADKFDVTEELSRLESHISQYQKLIKSKEPVGRSLDFLIQEMNREINTLGSKANDTAISKDVVYVKGLLEKLREEVQNIE